MQPRRSHVATFADSASANSQIMTINIIGSGALLPPPGQFSVGEIKRANYPLSPKTYLDRASELALCAAALALQDAGLQAPLGPTCGLALGTQFGSAETMRVFEDKLNQSGTRGASPLLFSHSYFNAAAALIAIEWEISGYHAPFCGTDSAWQAIETAREAIELNHADLMLCGGVEANSAARSWAGERQSGEGAFFVVLQRDGDGPTFDEFWQTPREVNGDWGALGAALARWRDFAGTAP